MRILLLYRTNHAVTDRLVIGVVVDDSELYVCTHPWTVIGPPGLCTPIGQQSFNKELHVCARPYPEYGGTTFL
jgi:hypothetical protein